MRLLTTAAALLAVLLAATTAGCGVDRAAAPEPEPTSTTATTTSTTTTTTTTTVPVPEVAADGTNLQACTDGTCEVDVKSGDVLTIRGEQLTVASVSPEGATFVLPSGTVASVGGTGTIGTASGTNVDILRNNGTTVLIRVS
ncbi:hypothetical protein [Actinophytocola algeriensis]|uniref:ABC-type transport system substrate-binding protein n=1 Tax=Actinophytocola algeriensis TaxID=1768010 RepID=A0A7W7VFD7_9PSEU|nr:hypothetical protein [Actinophytocola algeriensis]MBB4908191.1 ABC-type transport system substrate-binding protein [Actinophytocola algeriensis]MBE1480221.1 ABC-type transport system substrate-binding protein [Actinophytocola algeriensis]